MEQYIPGVCNIGKNERKKRRYIGFLSSAVLILYIILIYIVFANAISILTHLILFLLLFSTAISFIQDRANFCAQFGILGIYRFEGPMTQVQKKYLKKDRIKAIQIVFYSMLIAGIITFITIQIVS
jgi:hypothetical protein